MQLIPHPCNPLAPKKKSVTLGFARYRTPILVALRMTTRSRFVILVGTNQPRSAKIMLTERGNNLTAATEEQRRTWAARRPPMSFK